MIIDTSRALAKAGLIECTSCEGSGTVQVRNGGFAFDAACEECPGFIEGHDDALPQQQDGWHR